MTSFPTTTPERVRAVMDRHGLRQEDLAALMDPPVEQGTVSRWLTGASQPRPSQTLALRRLLGDVDPDGEPLPSRDQVMADWRAVISDAEARRKIALAAGDDAGVRASDSLLRLSRLTLQHLSAGE